MAQILISNLAVIKDFDVAFYKALMAELQEQGHQCIFWSNHTHPQLNNYYLPLEWFFKKENQTFIAPTKSEITEALKAIESDKWAARLKHINEVADTATAEQYVNFHAGISQKLIDTFKPDLFVAFNPLAPHTGIPYEICKARGIATITIERSAFLPQTLCLDSGGLMGHSELFNQSINDLIADNIDEYVEQGKEQLQKLNPQNFLRNNANTSASTNLLLGTGKLKVAVLGIDDRAVGIYPSNHPDKNKALPLFSSSAEGANAIAHALPEAIVVYKSHPSLTASYNQINNPAPNLEVLQATPDALVEWADVVVSAGTSVEVLALNLGKPVVLCGQSPINNKDICYQINRIDDIAATIRQAAQNGQTPQMLYNFRAFMGYCYRHYCITPNPDSPLAYSTKQSAQRLLKLIPSSANNKDIILATVQKKLLPQLGFLQKIKHLLG